MHDEGLLKGGHMPGMCKTSSWVPRPHSVPREARAPHHLVQAPEPSAHLESSSPPGQGPRGAVTEPPDTVQRVGACLAHGSTGIWYPICTLNPLGVIPEPELGANPEHHQLWLKKQTKKPSNLYFLKQSGIKHHRLSDSGAGTVSAF